MHNLRRLLTFLVPLHIGVKAHPAAVSDTVPAGCAAIPALPAARLHQLLSLRKPLLLKERFALRSDPGDTYITWLTRCVDDSITEGLVSTRWETWGYRDFPNSDSVLVCRFSEQLQVRATGWVYQPRAFRNDANPPSLYGIELGNWCLYNFHTRKYRLQNFDEGFSFGLAKVQEFVRRQKVQTIIIYRFPRLERDSFTLSNPYPYFYDRKIPALCFDFPVWKLECGNDWIYLDGRDGRVLLKEVAYSSATKE